MKFIKNPYNMFHTIKYEDKPKSIDFTQYTNTYVKVFYQKKGSSLKFESFMKKLLQQNPIDVIIIENENVFEHDDLNDNFEEENTVEICRNTVRKYIDENQITFGDKLEKKLLKLLHTAEQEEV